MPSVALGLAGDSLLAYVDPGLLSLVIQFAFVTVLGAIFTYLAAPWRWFRALFQRRSPGEDEATSHDAAEECADE